MPANHTELEKRLWGAADELRANSNLNVLYLPDEALFSVLLADIIEHHRQELKLGKTVR